MNKFEKKTKDYFNYKGLPIERVEEKDIKTPDFEGQEILVEVKSVCPQELEGLHEDSTYNAIKNNLQNAARQFRNHDPKHSKIHIVVLFSEGITENDIYSVWTGKFSPNNPAKIFKGGRLLSSNHRQHINAVVWFKTVTSTSPAYVWLASSESVNYFPEVDVNK